ncbi:hypothetical protein Tco_0021804 [Tanacetum coccineum]
MLMCKQAEKGVPLHAEQSDWLDDTDEEVDEQELEAYYNYMAKIREVLTVESGSDAKPLEKADQNAAECDDERVVLANLIELKECKSNLEETNKTLGESNRIRDRYLGALHDKEVELVKYTTYKDRTIENDTLERKLKETLGLLARKENDTKEVLKLKAYEISVVKEKNNELVK